MSSQDRYDYEIVVNLPNDTEETIRGSCYGAQHMVQSIEQHCPNYISAVVVFTIKRGIAKPD